MLAPGLLLSPLTLTPLGTHALSICSLRSQFPTIPKTLASFPSQNGYPPFFLLRSLPFFSEALGPSSTASSCQQQPLLPALWLLQDTWFRGGKPEITGGGITWTLAAGRRASVSPSLCRQTLQCQPFPVNLLHSLGSLQRSVVFPHHATVSRCSASHPLCPRAYSAWLSYSEVLFPN